MLSLSVSSSRYFFSFDFSFLPIMTIKKYNNTIVILGRSRDEGPFGWHHATINFGDNFYYTEQLITYKSQIKTNYDTKINFVSGKLFSVTSES